MKWLCRVGIHWWIFKPGIKMLNSWEYYKCSVCGQIKVPGCQQ